ncbi:response regulator [Mucilaginibacter flavus]|uniref:response regulator n=1 Tax=Mucilaginibacter flavus TaxID=931504 RepID=UPI0025B30E6F|nr:response regulator [Mucilaginibacter flavus]MDN3582952.1 response regulator [Mucilaginibacter flavus]
MRSFFLVIWFRDIPIAKKLHFTIGTMAFLIIIELLTLNFAVNTLSAIRTLIGAEGLWSKAQKDGLSHLRIYAYSHNEKDYQAFLQYMKVPLGDGIARRAIEQPNPDYETARKGFLAGRMHPDDVDDAIKLLHRFSSIKYIQTTVQYWKEAEHILMKIIPVSQQLHERVTSGTMSAEETKFYLDYIEKINTQLTPIADSFSFSLGEGSRWFENRILTLLVFLALSIELTGILIAISISKGIQNGIKAIMTGARMVEKERFVRVKVFSHDEIGQLATSFNQMTDKLELTITNLKAEEIKAKKEKERAEASEKIKRVFIANMSHEILTPMNAILGFALLMEESEMNDEQKQYMAAIRRSGEFLQILINNILDISKIEAGKVVLEHKPIDIHDLVKTAVSLLKPEAVKKALSLNYKIDRMIPKLVLGDGIRLSQILLNLINNAIKYTACGSVFTDAYVVNNIGDIVWIEFSVQDTGMGIPADKQEKIFESFDQIKQNNQLGGIGLGLSMAKHLVDLHGGKIFIKASNSKGSDFRVILPFQKQDVKPEQKSPQINIGQPSIGLPRAKGIRILVADDNHLNQLLIRKVLEKRNYDVDVVENGQLAVDKLSESYYDMILMDLDMPELNGYEATTAIRNFEGEKSGIPIIAITAHATADVMEKCYACGMNDFIAKPFDAEVLNQKILAFTNQFADVSGK